MIFAVDINPCLVYLLAIAKKKKISITALINLTHQCREVPSSGLAI